MCQRRRFDLVLTGKIATIHRRSHDTYGSPNIHAELADDHGICVSRKRVARLMRAAGIRGATLRRYVVTTTSDPQAQRPVDLVERKFFATAPDRLWVADITYIPTWSGFLYLAMVLDAYSSDREHGFHTMVNRGVEWAAGHRLCTASVHDRSSACGRGRLAWLRSDFIQRCNRSAVCRRRLSTGVQH
jgi:hypothetical protein